MINITPGFANRLQHSIPQFFLEDYPLFVKFFEYYYQWKNRNGGFNSKDLEYFSKTFNLDYETKSDLLEVIRLSNLKSPDQFRNEFSDEYLLERREKLFESNDEEIFLTADDEIYETPILNEDIVKDAIKQRGGWYSKDPLNLSNVDSILLERMLTHIHHIKGTANAAKLFFLIFFGEDLSQNVGQGEDIIKYAINEIIAIDHDLIIDGEGQIRDDKIYNEYSYIINTKYDQEYYEPLFSSIYMKYIHPSGFGVFLQKVE